MRKLCKWLFVVLMMLGFAANANAAETKQIKIGTLGWEDVGTISLIGKRFLEKEGYNVTVTTFADWGVAFAALTRGDVDVMVSHINYVTADYWAKNKERLEKLSAVSHGDIQGIVVPNYVNIKSIDQLNSVKDQMGGKIIGIEPGSGAMREAHNAVTQYGLQYTLVDGSTAAMTAQLQSSLERKQPIAVILWDPSWQFKKFPVKMLEDPKHVFAPTQTYYWIAKKGFAAANPHAREALASMFVPIDDVGTMTVQMKDGKTMDQAVDTWWNDHQVLVNKWSVMSK
jgi:glycine betaine/proline transport system substrate-binding protein